MRLERPDFPRNHLAADRSRGGNGAPHPHHRGLQDRRFAQYHDGRRPGTTTESMTLHSVYIWRANDIGTSAAVAYLL